MAVPPEFLKCAVEPISVGLHTLFIRVWESGRVPQEWRNGVVVPLFKGKGARNERSNYRPIWLLSVPGKVFANILLARLQPLLIGSRRGALADPQQYRSFGRAYLADQRSSY